MESLDDEVEKFPEAVSYYYFEDEKEEPISFSVLPVCWNTKEAVDGLGNKVYVRGKADDGLHKLYKPIKAWKFDISGEKPDISVLTECNNWIKLQKPRNSYEEFSRTMLITVNFLHLVKRNPESQGKGLWDKLSKILRLLGDKPSPDDIIGHKALIRKAVEYDDSLKNSKYLMMCVEKNFQKESKDEETAKSKGKNTFIVDDEDDCMTNNSKEGSSVAGEDDSGSEEDSDDDMFDSVCCICDEGGSILCCDGICMRSFHATPRAAKEADSKCISLGFSTKEVEAMQSFKCQNCQHKQHQCYSCGLLGCSDKNSVAEVFQCVNATCGYFYHPGCVAKRLHRDDVDAANAVQKEIAAGEAFTCPLHVCDVCRKPGDKTDSELRMAVCRRCPKAYHAKCLPREIGFEDNEEKGTLQRAWDELLVDRILIYCLEHEIDEDLGTPLRNHIRFPGDGKEKQALRQGQIKHEIVPNYRKPCVKALSRQGHASKPKKILPDNHLSKTTVRKTSKLKDTDTVRNLSVEKKSAFTNVENQSHAHLGLVKSSKFEKFAARKPVVELDSDSETRVLEFIELASSRITMDEVIRKHQKLISIGAYKQKMDLFKSITPGKVLGSCKAVREAISKLDAGCSIEDAKAICEPKILDQVARWKLKLKVYLAPFLYGKRYTPFGRHFTKTDKLQEIVDKVHWYVNDNDTIVDFCCGSNDFSWLMKQKLESMGKTCNYKNYDRFPAKIDFCFEQRNWMTVQPKELPSGSGLIMGLNPPFGVNASLANQFINKALEFKPKLLILIVPIETERLDKKRTHYDLVWEDRDKLSGKSFYLPGSVDINGNQVEDWNVITPILYLWSRHDWTPQHKAVAKAHCHLRGGEMDKGNERTLENFERVASTEADDFSPFVDDHEQFRERTSVVKQTALKDHFNIKRSSEEIIAKEDAELSRDFKRARSSPSYPHPENARGGYLSPSPLRYERSLANLEIRTPAHDHFERSTSFGVTSSGFEIPGSYSDKVGLHIPQMDIHPGLRAGYPVRVTSLTDYPSRISCEWGAAYMNDTNRPYSQPAYRSMTTMSVMDKHGPNLDGLNHERSVIDQYGPRLDEPNHARMSGYIPDIGHSFEPHTCNYGDPRQEYLGAPIGVVPRPHESFPRVSEGQGVEKHGKRNKSKGKMNSKDGADRKCFYCNEMGHWKRNCPKYLQDLKKA